MKKNSNSVSIMMFVQEARTTLRETMKILLLQIIWLDHDFTHWCPNKNIQLLAVLLSKFKQVCFTLLPFSYVRYLSTALAVMPKWDLASETMIKTIKGEVVWCPCKLQAAVVSAMVSNTCPASDHWIHWILDRPPPRSVVGFWEGIFFLKVSHWRKES